LCDPPEGAPTLLDGELASNIIKSNLFVVVVAVVVVAVVVVSVLPHFEIP
jgi:hypothetical protein